MIQCNLYLKNRFKFKINDYCEFPFNLDMEPYSNNIK